MLPSCLLSHSLCCRADSGRDVTKHGIPLPFLVPAILTTLHLRRCNEIPTTPSRCRGCPATLPIQRR